MPAHFAAAFSPRSWQMRLASARHLPGMEPFGLLHFMQKKAGCTTLPRRSWLLHLPKKQIAGSATFIAQAFAGFFSARLGLQDQAKSANARGTDLTGDGSIHWQQPREQEKKAFSPLNNHQTRSVDIVMTSYVLLAHVEKKPAPSPEEMSISSRIAKWLTGQQNPTGGFLSTQDTVVALQALSKYSTLDYSQSRAVSKVSLSSGADFQKEFHVDSTNSLLLQSQALPKVPGNYQAEVTGGRSVLLQTTLKYNVHPDQEEPPFKLDLHTVPEACMDPKAQTKFALALNLSYTGQRANSNMVIVDVKMLSGFIPVKSSVQKVTVLSVHQRTEVSTDRVLLYLEEVTSVTQHYSFMVEQEVPVQGLKPAFVTVYDYYEPDEKAVAAYSAPCSTGTV
uniref:Alpha-macroglobulin receptor-binding domain-containing protein n=1 Tax=Varanus komodoensis TaxID=61221 RepID=A0A8D2L7E9_VARKO